MWGVAMVTILGRRIERGSSSGREATPTPGFLGPLRALNLRSRELSRNSNRGRLTQNHRCERFAYPHILFRHQNPEIMGALS